MKGTKWMVRTYHDGRQTNFIYDTKRDAMKHIEAYNTNDYSHILCKLSVAVEAEWDTNGEEADHD